MMEHEEYNLLPGGNGAKWGLDARQKLISKDPKLDVVFKERRTALMQISFVNQAHALVSTLM